MKPIENIKYRDIKPCPHLRTSPKGYYECDSPARALGILHRGDEPCTLEDAVYCPYAGKDL